MIFVSIASYRDKELVKTVNSCLNNAKYPDQIRIGICWQYDETEDISTFDGNAQIQIHKVYWKDVEGSVCWARSLVQRKFFNNEKYYFQVDSHTQFTQDWDELLIKMYEDLHTDKAIISVGPSYYYDLEAEGALPHYEWEPVEFINGIYRDTELKKQKLDVIGHTHFMYGFLPADDLSAPIPARHISAAFLFTIGQWVYDVPYDPSLYFSGEEPTLTLRSYTNGYDIFNPNKFIIWHLKYSFNDRKRHWNTFDPEIIQKLEFISNDRYKNIVNGNDMGIYGIGTKRTLFDWEIYSGVSFKDVVAHPNTFKGLVPAPVTIVDVDEWNTIKSRDIK